MTDNDPTAKIFISYRRADSAARSSSDKCRTSKLRALRTAAVV